jgi:hypothetical protein
LNVVDAEVVVVPLVEVVEDSAVVTEEAVVASVAVEVCDGENFYASA